MTSVYVKKNGTWVPTPDNAVVDLVYAHYLGTWKPVRMAQVYKQDVVTHQWRWHTMFERKQPPPASVKGVPTTSLNAGSVTWTAPVGAAKNVLLEYQVRRYEAGVAAPYLYPWTRAMTQAFSGLKLETRYDFEVAVRATTGVQVENVTATRAKLLTGSLAVNHRPTVAGKVVDHVTVYIQPVNTDTWSSANKWEESKGNVVQGYASEKSRNGHGVVRYNSTNDSLRANVITGLKNLKQTQPTLAADDATVVATRISSVYRGNTNKLGATMSVYVYPCLVNVASNREPENAGVAASRANFTAPAEGQHKTAFTIKDTNAAGSSDDVDRLTIWAQAWLRKTNTHNGILILRTDGGNATQGFNGYAVFRGDTYDPDWRLEMDLTWNFNEPDAVSAKWLA